MHHKRPYQAAAEAASTQTVGATGAECSAEARDLGYTDLRSLEFFGLDTAEIGTSASYSLSTRLASAVPFPEGAHKL